MVRQGVVVVVLAWGSACARRPDGALPAGTYECRTIDDAEKYLPSVLGPIVIEGARYTVRGLPGEGRGSYALDGRLVAFAEGPLDGWRAAFGTSEAGAYLRFRGTSTGAPGDQRRSGDHLCFVGR
jgi:hypothetical protein